MERTPSGRRIVPQRHLRDAPAQFRHVAFSNGGIFRLPSPAPPRDVAAMKQTLLALTWAVALAISARAHVAAEEMTSAADKFLTSLDAGQRTAATFEFKDDERQNWFFIPKARKGLTLQKMTQPQRLLALSLLHSGLSDHGYTRATNIISLELILKELEAGRGTMVRDPELYYVSIFGKPAAKGTWGWRVEGHHFTANFTIVNGELFSGTPSFLGTNPAEVRQGPRKGLRILGEEEDNGRTLLKALDPDQRKTATYDATAPKDVITGNKRKVTPLDTAGLPAAKMSAAQKKLLATLVQSYVHRLRSDLAAMDLAAIEKAGWDKVWFAWAGGTEKGDPHYYRVQGPTFLLEYDNTQNDANHVHAVWRDFNNDFGEDLLRQHYRDAHP